MPHSITVELSELQFQHLQRASELTQQPIQSLVSQSISQNITPFLEDIPEQYQPDLLPLLQMAEAELYREAQATFPASKWNVYEQLLTKQKEQMLSTDERHMLDLLRREADILMLRKGYAALLLKRRGYQISDPQELPSPN